MLFKYPNLLYFLFLLIIPIIVHLFQLRRFKKEYFTNVKFLKEISLKTRKSSELKKWLLLLTRMALLTVLILAFAQPHFEYKIQTPTDKELIILLDNSYSMQAKGKNGELLKQSVQQLLEKLPEEQKFSLFTINDAFHKTDLTAVRKELQHIDYASDSFDWEHMLMRAKLSKSSKPTDVLVITDGLSFKEDQLREMPPLVNFYFHIPKPEDTFNVSIDSLYLKQTTDDFYELEARFSWFGTGKNTVPVALYDQQQAVAKIILEPQQEKALFTLPKNDFSGHLQIEDQSLSYDNSYYFTISKPEKVNILAIGPPVKSKFLEKIYSSESFDLISSDIQTLDYNLIEQQDIIILNELDHLSEALITNLKSFADNGGHLVFIPSLQTSSADLTSFTTAFRGITFSDWFSQKKHINKIIFGHQLFKNVFERKVDNFEYPHTKQSLRLEGALFPILVYEDGSPFLAESKKDLSSIYIFSAPISSENSNFLNSPLVVLTLYNMAQNLGVSGVKSHQIGSDKPVVIETPIQRGQVLHISNKNSDFIPSQQVVSKSVKLFFDENPTHSGLYNLSKNGQSLSIMGFNYPRTESDLNSEKSDLWKDFEKSSIADFIQQYQAPYDNHSLWKWLLGLGVLLLLLEVLIQRLIK